VNVYGCRRCGTETNDNTVCKAPTRDFASGYKPFQKPEEQTPWGNLVPGSLEYANALNEAAVELTKKKNINLVKAYVECKRQGWQLELYDLGEDVREALVNAGLLPPDLNEAIKNLQEDSK